MTTRRRFLTLLTTAALTLTLITTSSLVAGKGKPGGGGKTPTLTVTLNPPSIEEGKSATATVTRSTSVGNVAVTLGGNDGTEALVFAPDTATVEPTVTVPLNDGQTTATFTVNGVDDGIADGNQAVVITA